MTNLLKDIVLSFYSGRFYHELGRRRRGIGFPYILFLTVLIVLALWVGGIASGFTGKLSHAMETAPQWVSALPSFTIRDHQLSIDKPSPYRVSPGDDKTAIVIDTNYKVTDLDALKTSMRDNKTPVLITADKIIIYKENEGKLEVYDFSNVKQDIIFSHENWAGFGEWLRQWGMVSLLAFSFCVFFPILLLGNLILVFFNGLVVLVLGLVMRANLDLAAAMRLSAAYAIPVHIVPPLLRLAGVSTGLSGWVLWFVYLLFSVWESRPGAQTGE